MARAIELGNGMVAAVDDVDYEWLSSFTWTAMKGRDSFYAGRWETFVREDGTTGGRVRHMQQDILYPGRPCPRGMKADHWNRDTLDNQRHNLRLVSDSISNINRRLFKTNSSGYRGVSFDKIKGKWAAMIRVQGVRHARGGFISPEDAARAYNSLARFHHGEHANLNIIPGGGPQFLDGAIAAMRPSRGMKRIIQYTS